MRGGLKDGFFDFLEPATSSAATKHLGIQAQASQNYPESFKL